MSILDAIKETRRESKNLSELALLPQALIMQMAQRGELTETEVPLIIGKKAQLIEDAARNAALAQSGQVPPTVMEKNMMTIAQDENPAPPQQMMQAQMQEPQFPEDVGIAQNYVPPMQMAGGGIIAFDEGGDVDDEDDEYEEMLAKAREDDINDQMYDMISSMGGSAGTGITTGYRGAEEGISSFASPNRGTEEGAINRRDAEGGGSGDLANRLRAEIMQRESGGRRFDKEGNLLTSSKGALGEMQVMPATARDPGFGIKPARDNSPDELRRVGDEYAEVLLNKYRDPKLAMIAYNMGPGATDRWLASGADPRRLPKETQGYIRGVNLAEGGEVRYFVGGGTMEGFGDALDEREEEVEYDPYFAEGTFSGYRKKAPRSQVDPRTIIQKRSAAKKTEPVKTIAPPAAAPAEEAPKSGIPQNPEGIKNIRKEAEEETFNLMKYVQDRQAKIDASEKKDLAIAGLAAGLGMLGGTSPYAMVNIGQGGQMGVQQLASLRKSRAGQEAALGKLYGSASQADLMNKLRRDQLAQNKEQKEDKLAQDLLVKRNDYIEKRLKATQMDEIMLKNLQRKKDEGKLDTVGQTRLNSYERERRDAIREANRMFPASGTGRGVIKLD